MSLKYLLLPFFYFLATNAFAGEHLWTLKECTDYALSHSLDIKVQQNTGSVEKRCGNFLN